METKWKSKWRDRQCDLKDLELERRQAAFQADELKEIIEGLGHSVGVRPVVVAWGPGIPTDETFVGFGQIGVLVGERWKDWPERALARDSLSAEQAAAIGPGLSRLAEQTAPREPSVMTKSFRVARALLAPSVQP